MHGQTTLNVFNSFPTSKLIMNTKIMRVYDITFSYSTEAIISAAAESVLPLWE